MAFLIIISIILVFGFVVFFGAPYLPTLSKAQETALDLLDLKPGQTLLELGSGDGKVMRAAAKRELNVIGIELNPVLVIISYFVTFRYRKQVKIIWGNFWTKDFPDCDGIYVFLLNKYMKKLDKKVADSCANKVILASNSFKIPGKKHQKYKNGIYLYQY